MKVRFAAVAVALALAAGACSSDKESNTTSAPAGTAAAAATEAAAGTEAPAGTEASGGTEAPAGTEAAGDAGAGTAMDNGDTGCIVSGGGKATGTPIKVGSIQGKTGPADFSSSGQGAKAFFECVNANGGIDGHPIDYLIEDDQWTPEIAAQAAGKLINDEGVVAMVGSSSFVECGTNAALYDEQGVLALYGTGVPRECFASKNIDPTNAGPRNSALGAAQYLAREKGATSFVCIAQNIPNTGGWVCPGVEDWAKSAGYTARSILHDPAAPDLGSVLQDALSDKPSAILLMEPAGLAVAFLAEAEKEDLRDETMWAGPTSLYLNTFPDTIGDYWWGHVTVQAELTTIDADTPDNQAWLKVMDQYGSPDDPRDTFSQAGWLAAKIFTQTALEIGGDNVTRDTINAALPQVKNYRSDLMCTPWYWGDGERHNANHAGRVMEIDENGNYVKVQDCQEVADPELDDILAGEAAAPDLIGG